MTSIRKKKIRNIDKNSIGLVSQSETMANFKIKYFEIIQIHIRSMFPSLKTFSLMFPFQD